MLQFLEINPAYIRPRPGNRDARDFADLQASIADVGLLQPLAVRKVFEPSKLTKNITIGEFNGQYELVAGERRWRAVTELKWETVPCVVLDETEDRVNDALNAKRGVAENYQRKDLTPLDEMAVFTNLVHDGLTVEDLAQVSGRSPGYVRGRLALSSLGTEARDAIAEGKITIAHALVLCHAVTPEMQVDWLARILRGGYGYGEVMSAAQARRHFLDGWRHDEFAWPASFVEPCPACRLPQQPSLFEDEEKPDARCFDREHLTRTNAAYLEAFRAWAEKKGLEVSTPEFPPYHLSYGKKQIVGLTPRPKKGTKRLVAWVERGAIAGWLPMTQEEIDAEKPHSKRSSSSPTPNKPELPELRRRAAEKAATRHLLFAVHEVLEKKKSPPALLLAYALIKHADSMDRGKILEAAGLPSLTYKPWPALKAATEKQHQQVIRGAIEAALARENYGYGNEKIQVQASAARVLGIDPVASYAATEEDLKAMPREALVSALAEDLRGDSKHKKGELVKGAVGSKLDAGVAGWTELRELLASPEPEISKEDYEDDDEGLGAEEEDDVDDRADEDDEP